MTHSPLGFPLVPKVALPLLAVLAGSLSACVFYPQRAEVDESDCRMMMRKLELNVTVPPSFDCSGGDARACLAVITAVSAGTAVISGSIVVLNNTLYWTEKQGRCNLARVVVPKQPKAN